MLRPFPHRWRFSVYTQHAVRVVKWHLQSSALTHLEASCEQWPALCWEIGHHVVETTGPADLMMMALVELVENGQGTGRMMPMPLQREALP